jgi:hypothetical protein
VVAGLAAFVLVEKVRRRVAFSGARRERLPDPVGRRNYSAQFA